MTTFNNDWTQVSKPSESPLAAVSYIPSRPARLYQRDVMQVMANTDWHDLFGLSYEETLNLPMFEWRLLRDYILKQPRKQDTTNALLVAMTTKMGGVASAPSGKSDSKGAMLL